MSGPFFALLRDHRYVEVTAEDAEDLAARWPASRRGLFECLGLPDARTASTFTASRLTRRATHLSDAGHAEVVSRLGWAAEDLGYPVSP